MSKPTNQPGVGKVLSLALPIHEAVCTSVWLFVALSLSVFPTSVCECVCLCMRDCVCAATQVSSSSISLQFSAKHIIYFAKAKHQASATVAKWFPLSNNMRVCNYTTIHEYVPYKCMDECVIRVPKKILCNFNKPLSNTQHTSKYSLCIGMKLKMKVKHFTFANWD